MLPELYPHDKTRERLVQADPANAEHTAFRNGTLQGGYFILAARAVGLDCGPMSGFDNAGVDANSFPTAQMKSNFLCALGLWRSRAPASRAQPRLSFDEACRSSEPAKTVVKILACDTALGACSAAVLDGERVLARAVGRDGARPCRSARADGRTRDASEAGIAFAALDRLAVTTGPGTFTGQRVGLAFMRAAALALKIPLVGVTTLEAMAAEALARRARPLGVAVADAKRGEVYLGALDGKDGTVLLEASLAFPSMPRSPWPRSLTQAARRARARRHRRPRRCSPPCASTASPPPIPACASPTRCSSRGLPRRRPRPMRRREPLYLRAPDAKLPS